MCLAIPGKIVKVFGNSALVDFNGITQNVIVALIPNPQIGTYVIVHAGYAIETVDEKRALESIEQWKQIAEDQDLNLSKMI